MTKQVTIDGDLESAAADLAQRTVLRGYAGGWFEKTRAAEVLLPVLTELAELRSQLAAEKAEVERLRAAAEQLKGDVRAHVHRATVAHTQLEQARYELTATRERLAAYEDPAHSPAAAKDELEAPLAREQAPAPLPDEELLKAFNAGLEALCMRYGVILCHEDPQGAGYLVRVNPEGPPLQRNPGDWIGVQYVRDTFW